MLQIQEVQETLESLQDQVAALLKAQGIVWPADNLEGQEGDGDAVMSFEEIQAYMDGIKAEYPDQTDIQDNADGTSKKGDESGTGLNEFAKGEDAKHIAQALDTAASQVKSASSVEQVPNLNEFAPGEDARAILGGIEAAAEQGKVERMGQERYDAAVGSGKSSMPTPAVEKTTPAAAKGSDQSRNEPSEPSKIPKSKTPILIPRNSTYPAESAPSGQASQTSSSKTAGSAQPQQPPQSGQPNKPTQPEAKAETVYGVDDSGSWSFTINWNHPSTTIKPENIAKGSVNGWAQVVVNLQQETGGAMGQHGKGYQVFSSVTLSSWFEIC